MSTVYKLDVQVLAYYPNLGPFKSLFPTPLLDLRSTCVVCPTYEKFHYILVIAHMCQPWRAYGIGYRECAAGEREPRRANPVVTFK